MRRIPLEPHPRMPADQLLDDIAVRIVVVALVLVHPNTIALDPADRRHGRIEQIVRRIEREALAQLRLHGRQDAPDRIVAAACDAIALVVDRHQIADLVVFVTPRDDGRRALAWRLRQQPPHRVVPELADERPLRAGDHPVRTVTLDVGDNLAVQVHLVQMPRAVVQVVQDTAIRQRRLHTSAQLKQIIRPVLPQPHDGWRYRVGNRANDSICSIRILAKIRLPNPVTKSALLK